MTRHRLKVCVIRRPRPHDKRTGCITMASAIRSEKTEHLTPACSRGRQRCTRVHLYARTQEAPGSVLSEKTFCYPLQTLVAGRFRLSLDATVFPIPSATSSSFRSQRCAFPPPSAGGRWGEIRYLLRRKRSGPVIRYSMGTAHTVSTDAAHGRSAQTQRTVAGRTDISFSFGP